MAGKSDGQKGTQDSNAEAGESVAASKHSADGETDSPSGNVDNRLYGAYARRYCDNGWWGPLPMPPKHKEAPPTGFTGHGAPYPSPRQIANWVKRHPNGNIAIRLGEVPPEIIGQRDDVPVIYGGNNVDGWELIGIDVDAYGDKNGAEQFRELEAQLGELPPTATSSSRWAGNDGPYVSGVRIFLVPKGYKYKGKAAKHIDILYRGLRYMAAPPSIHPSGRAYEWRWGPTAVGRDAGEPDGETVTGESTWEAFDGLPHVGTDDVAVLPLAWFNHLNIGSGTADWDSADIDYGAQSELVSWAVDTLTTAGCDPDTPCKMMDKEAQKYVDELDTSDSHTPLNKVLWRLTMNGIEGHHGWRYALQKYVDAWLESVVDKRDVNSALSEVNRSLVGAVTKAKYIFENERGAYVPDDPCEPHTGGYSPERDPGNRKTHSNSGSDKGGASNEGNGASSGDSGDDRGDGSSAGAWADRFDAGGIGGDNVGDGHDGLTDGSWNPCDSEERIAAGDYGGLGPIVGKLNVYANKPADNYDRNDRGNGEHFIDIYDEDVKYVESRQSWILWDGERWHRDTGDKLIGLAFKRVEKAQKFHATTYDLNDPNERKLADVWKKWSMRSGNASQIRNALTMASGMYASESRVALSGNEFDAMPTLLGCANGVLDLKHGAELRAPAKDDYVTYNTGTPYVPWRDLVNAEGEVLEGWQLWQEYLNRFLPDKRLQEFVQKTLGHMLVGGNLEKLIVFLWGPHDTGKSTMLSAIAGALGDYYGTIDMKLFKEQDKNPALVRAVPLRVTAMSEIESGVMDAGVIKRLTGNDRVMAELKYSNEIFEGTPQFSTIIACNNQPNIRHSDEALEERLLVLPFLTEMPRVERKFDRQKEIEQHSRVAVLSWLVEGWKAYRETGLKRDMWPPVVRKHNLDFAAGLNPTQGFIRENLERARDSEAGQRVIKRALDRAAKRGKHVPTVADYPIEWTPSSQRVYELYARWCMKNGVNADSHPNFVKDLGVGQPELRRVDGKAVRCYKGLRLKDAEEVGRVDGVKLK